MKFLATLSTCTDFERSTGGGKDEELKEGGEVRLGGRTRGMQGWKEEELRKKKKDTHTVVAFI